MIEEQEFSRQPSPICSRTRRSRKLNLSWWVGAVLEVWRRRGEGGKKREGDGWGTKRRGEERRGEERRGEERRGEERRGEERRGEERRGEERRGKKRKEKRREEKKEKNINNWLGLSTYLHLDKFRSRIPQHIPVHGIADAGFFMDYPSISGIFCSLSLSLSFSLFSYSFSFLFCVSFFLSLALLLVNK